MLGGLALTLTKRTKKAFATTCEGLNLLERVKRFELSTHGLGSRLYQLFYQNINRCTIAFSPYFIGDSGLLPVKSTMHFTAFWCNIIDTVAPRCTTYFVMFYYALLTLE